MAHDPNSKLQRYHSGHVLLDDDISAYAIFKSTQTLFLKRMGEPPDFPNVILHQFEWWMLGLSQLLGWPRLRHHRS